MRDEMQAHVDRRYQELRRHFDVVAEEFRSDFKNLFDWTEETTSTIGARVDGIEEDHGSRLTSLEVRVTRIEQRDKP
jgi:hypothetical protein